MRQPYCFMHKFYIYFCHSINSLINYNIFFFHYYVSISIQFKRCQQIQSLFTPLFYYILLIFYSQVIKLDISNSPFNLDTYLHMLLPAAVLVFESAPARAHLITTDFLCFFRFSFNFFFAIVSVSF